ncbi:MAG: pyridoxamine 5'-phosphate oxidase family protein, partial [Alphaproteobacteria bacterium]
MSDHSAPASPFHAGERAAQARMGADDVGRWAVRAIRPSLPDQHRAFFEGLAFVAVAARDRTGQPWATLLAGPPGFAASPDPETLAVASLPAEGDPLAGAIRAGADIGLLGIDFATRRRNRANGRVLAADDRGFRLSVRQSFGNCPQHSHVRDWRPV